MQAEMIFALMVSLSIKVDIMTTKTMLNLSIDTTLDVSPSCSALKKQSHDKPVIMPDKIKNSQHF